MAVPADSIRASRRLFIAAGPCAAVFGALAAAAAVDPIRAAISAHRAAARVRAREIELARRGVAGLPALEEATDAEIAAAEVFAATTPTTRLGIREMLAYALEIDLDEIPSCRNAIAETLLRSPALAA